MEPSSELGAVVGRLFAAMNARDAATCLNLLADEPGFLFIGTDPDEWWAGFSDIEGSTDLAVRLGDSRWLELLRWHDALVADRAAREGGRVVKSLGDGHMIAFSSASRALRSAIDIQRSLREPHDGEQLQLRIGLHTGECLREADDFFGHGVVDEPRVHIGQCANATWVLIASNPSLASSSAVLACPYQTVPPMLERLDA